MKLNILFAVVCLAILGFVIVSRGGVAPTPPAFEATPTDLASAVAKARAEGKVVVAVASADWCPPCQTYKRKALVDDEVSAWLDNNAVTIVVDVTDRTTPNPDASALGVGPIPATYMINAEGQLVASAVGALNPDQLSDWLTDNAGR